MSYAETAALEAVLEDRLDDARALLAGFHRYELATFAQQVHQLLTLVREARDA